MTGEERTEEEYFDLAFKHVTLLFNRSMRCYSCYRIMNYMKWLPTCVVKEIRCEPQDLEMGEEVAGDAGVGSTLSRLMWLSKVAEAAIPLHLKYTFSTTNSFACR